MVNNLMIVGFNIKCNEKGLYSLNDIHRASGSKPKNTPARWLERKGTQDLIDSALKRLNNEKSASQKWEGILEVNNGGADHGVYAHELLVVSYAGWIDSDFQIEVNYTFLETIKERATALEKENKKLLEFKDETYRRSLLDKHLNSRFPSQSEKVAKDIKMILRIIKNQGKEVFERISHPIRATSSEKSHREAWEYLEREGIIVKTNKSCKFTGAPMYRIAK